MAFFRISWLPVAALSVISAALLLTAFMFEHIGGLAPCELCWYQRYAYMAVIAILLPALYFHSNASVVAPLLAAAGLALLVGTGIAGYQVGVERSWWESACATPIRGESLDEIRASLMAAPVVRCDEVAWSLWEISMAGWNGLVSLALGAGALYAAFMTERIK
ncbi:MAG: disulfide bond formation protein B [Rhodospirillaceae bacterium]|nr:disulfide bond formation protein B [Rhodospirillaceae bacterium]